MRKSQITNRKTPIPHRHQPKAGKKRPLLVEADIAKANKTEFCNRIPPEPDMVVPCAAEFFGRGVLGGARIWAVTQVGICASAPTRRGWPWAASTGRSHRPPALRPSRSAPGHRRSERSESVGAPYSTDTPSPVELLCLAPVSCTLGRVRAGQGADWRHLCRIFAVRCGDSRWEAG